jgi:hypothetical protein
MKIVKNFSEFVNESVEVETSEVWYTKKEYFRNYISGSKYLPEGVKLPDPDNLEATHAFIGNVDTLNLDEVFEKMQGEFWSEGEGTNEILKSKNVGHTSMSVGDIIKNENGVFMVEDMGFFKLNK